jgi:hypothetical protein
MSRNYAARKHSYVLPQIKVLFQFLDALASIRKTKFNFRNSNCCKLVSHFTQYCRGYALQFWVIHSTVRISVRFPSKNRSSDISSLSIRKWVPARKFTRKLNVLSFISEHGNYICCSVFISQIRICTGVLCHLFQTWNIWPYKVQHSG